MLYSPEWEINFIDDWERAREAIDNLLTCALVAVDTETAGWQYGSNRLCLAQFSSEEIRTNYIFDCIALENCSDLFKPVIESKEVKKVAHNVSFEYKIFESLGLELKNYECTLELAKKIRPHLDGFRLSTLTEHFLGYSLDKSLQTSDWSRRPLSDSQILYAASDAEVTYKIFVILKSIKDKLDYTLSQDIDGLLKSFKELTLKRADLIKPIFDELSDVDYLLEEIKQRVKVLLPKYDNYYENEYGSARLQEVRKTEVSIELLKKKYPEIADQVIEPYVKRDKLKAIWREFNLSPSLMEELIIDVGKNFRLQIEVKD